MNTPTNSSATSISNLAPSSSSLFGSGVDFPFNFLHIEIVRFLKSRDEEINSKKEEWVKHCKASDFADVLNQNNSIVHNQIFSQVSNNIFDF